MPSMALTSGGSGAFLSVLDDSPVSPVDWLLSFYPLGSGLLLDPETGKRDPSKADEQASVVLNPLFGPALSHERKTRSSHLDPAQSSNSLSAAMSKAAAATFATSPSELGNAKSWSMTRMASWLVSCCACLPLLKKVFERLSFDTEPVLFSHQSTSIRCSPIRARLRTKIGNTCLKLLATLAT